MNKNQLKQVQSLKYAKYRKLYGKFFIEGSRLVKGAHEWSSTVEGVYCTEAFYKDNHESSVFNDIEKDKIKIVTERMFKNNSRDLSYEFLLEITKRSTSFQQI